MIGASPLTTRDVMTLFTFGASRRLGALALITILAGACAPPDDSTAQTAEVAAPSTAPVAAKSAEPQTVPAAVAEPEDQDTPAPSTEVRQGGDVSLLPAQPDARWMQKGLVIGSWSLDPALGLDEAWIDEEELREAFTKDRVKRREWKGFSSQTARVPIDNLMQKKPGPIFGYIYALVQRNRPDQTWPDEEAVLHITHHGPMKAWFDGRPVFDEDTPSGTSNTVRMRVTLTDAYDVVLIKVGSPAGESLDVTVVLSDLSGKAIDFMAWNTVRIPGIPRDIPLRER